MSGVEHGSDGLDGVSSERQAYETRIASLERSRATVDRLTRFQAEAYKTRIAELKRLLARERAEKLALARELASLHGQRQQLNRLLRRFDRSSKTKSETPNQGDGR